jgi:mycothiol synthase
MTVRTPTRDDAGAIASICTALSQQLYGVADLDERAVGDWFGLSDLAMFLAEDGGRAVGYADVRDDDHLRYPIDLRIHPDAWGAGVGAELLAAAEDWSRGRAAPDAVLRGFAAERDTEAQRVLADAGYRLIRHSFLMEIDLHDRLEEPVWPEGLTVRTFDPDRDERAVYECQEETFSDHWDYHPIPFERWREFSVESAYFAPELWWLVEQDGELAAICLNAWHFSGDPTFGWIGVLGVRRPWRRQGLGLALLRHSFRDFAARAATHVGLGVDAENTTGAVRLYERAGMRPVRRNDAFEKRVDG